eukprot:Seg3664.5 transcript_id=Seg3664.5/GoldUCD/mRNA.D3Y31 product="Kinetochore protein Spc24" protein_id=Seg3664.5/GoldUCD/D3Y31
MNELWYCPSLSCVATFTLLRRSVFWRAFRISVDQRGDKMADELAAKIKLGSKLVDEYSADCDCLVPKFEHHVIEHEKEMKMRDQNLKDVKEIMNKLKESFVEGEERAANLGDDGFAEEMFESNKEKKLQAEERINEELQKLESKKKETESELTKSNEQFAMIEQKKEKLEKEKITSIPDRKNIFDLYTITTGIRWNFGSADNEIRGYVTGNNDIKPFSLNSEEHDNFYVSNYLWDVIESAFEN